MYPLVLERWSHKYWSKLDFERWSILTPCQPQSPCVKCVVRRRFLVRHIPLPDFENVPPVNFQECLLQYCAMAKCDCVQVVEKRILSTFRMHVHACSAIWVTDALNLSQRSILPDKFNRTQRKIKCRQSLVLKLESSVCVSPSFCAVHRLCVEVSCATMWVAYCTKGGILQCESTVKGLFMQSSSRMHFRFR